MHSPHHIDSTSSEDDETPAPTPHRRNSVSEDLGRDSLFLVNVAKTRSHILRHEDTDGDERVTIEDRGPKHVKLPSYNSGGFLRRSVRGNYQVSSLLQELSLMELRSEGAHGPSPLARPNVPAIITGHQLMENPVLRLTRMIRQYFWPALRRSIDAEGIRLICADPKNRGPDKRPRIYIPFNDIRGLKYFYKVSESLHYLNLDVVQLPAVITPAYVQSLNDKPGILALDLEEVHLDGESETHMVGKPFVVPGGRFNEMYGWDSYFCVLGLLEDAENPNSLYIAKSMVENFVYQINNYGRILNANRSYYLLRSQPPFLTDMALRVYDRLVASGEKSDVTGHWLREAMMSAIKEYRAIWMSEPRLIAEVGLSRYCSEGVGVPPETESSHFDSVLQPYAAKWDVGIRDFIGSYNLGEIEESELDEYFLHDRAVRESGHDTTYRLDGKAAHLLTVDLCALLYKYEADISKYLEDECAGELKMPNGEMELLSTWRAAMERRLSLANKFLWDEERKMYFDYDFIKKEKTDYESATTFWPMWAGMCCEEQAEDLVKKALPLLEEAGGLVSGTKRSLGKVSLDRPNRQWDYPFGWTPHQMLAWMGLSKYHFEDDCRRLVYRWLYMITRAFTDFNGVVPEKFDVVKMSHKVNVEYGNVGTEFKRVPQEGFGWMNASYLFGLKYLNLLERRALGALVPPESLIQQFQRLVRPQ